MSFTDVDYEAIREGKNSLFWKLICKEIDDVIHPIESVLLDPNIDEMMGTEDEKKQASLLKYKKMERIHLINLKNLPDKLLATKIK